MPPDLKYAVLRLAEDTYRRGETARAGDALPPDVQATAESYREVRL